MNDEKRYFDKEAPQWDDNPGRVRMANSIADALLGSIPVNRTMRVLDFGCGTGIVSLRIQPLVESITAIDSSRSMLAVLAEKVASRGLKNIMAQHLDIEQGQLLSGQYDLVVCSMTLHHVKDPAALLHQFGRVLVPGGQFGLADLEPDQGMFHGDNRSVFHNGFSRDNMRGLLEETGFENIKFRNVTTIPRFVPGGIKEFKIFLAYAQKA
jgi:ubiquinone/menaquinone biosynthesis C-methylase UbiE